MRQEAVTIVPVNTHTQRTTSFTPIREWLSSDAERIVKEPLENEILKPWKSCPCTNKGIYYHNGCGSNAQPIGPSMRVQRPKRNFPSPIGPQQALVLQLQTLLWLHSPQSHHQLFF